VSIVDAGSVTGVTAAARVNRANDRGSLAASFFVRPDLTAAGRLDLEIALRKVGNALLGVRDDGDEHTQWC
jgi:Mrp family chromosome partitioning ATPase